MAKQLQKQAKQTLRQEFDALLARMQTSRARRGMKAAFAASGKRMGKAAVAATRAALKMSK
jgi:hypothetical protein